MCGGDGGGAAGCSIVIGGGGVEGSGVGAGGAGGVARDSSLGGNGGIVEDEGVVTGGDSGAVIVVSLVVLQGIVVLLSVAMAVL